jgi:hypothetical protein
MEKKEVNKNQYNREVNTIRELMKMKEQGFPKLYYWTYD